MGWGARMCRGQMCGSSGARHPPPGSGGVAEQEPVVRLRPGRPNVPNDSSRSASPSVPAGRGCATRSWLRGQSCFAWRRGETEPTSPPGSVGPCSEPLCSPILSQAGHGSWQRAPSCLCPFRVKAFCCFLPLSPLHVAIGAVVLA